MSIAFRCPCGRSLKAAPEQAGKKTKCPGCGNVLTIPAGGNGVTATPPAPRPASSGGGAVVTCACGKKIATIDVPEGTTNVCFGGKDMHTLFITAGTSLYAVKMRVKGAARQ